MMAMIQAIAINLITSLTNGFNSTYIMPGTVGYDEDYQFNFTINLGGTMDDDNKFHLSQIYDSSVIHQTDPNIMNKTETVSQASDRYMEKNVNNVQNGKVYLPFTTTYLDNFMFGTQMTNQVGQKGSRGFKANNLN
jgi:hypothetical protein